jgi:hypothetical protein
MIVSMALVYVGIWAAIVLAFVAFLIVYVIGAWIWAGWRQLFLRRANEQTNVHRIARRLGGCDQGD